MPFIKLLHAHGVPEKIQHLAARSAEAGKQQPLVLVVGADDAVRAASELREHDMLAEAVCSVDAAVDSLCRVETLPDAILLDASAKGMLSRNGKCLSVCADQILRRFLLTMS